MWVTGRKDVTDEECYECAERPPSGRISTKINKFADIADVKFPVDR
jgi:hypothetical protein